MVSNNSGHKQPSRITRTTHRVFTQERSTHRTPARRLIETQFGIEATSGTSVITMHRNTVRIAVTGRT